MDDAVDAHVDRMEEQSDGTTFLLTRYVTSGMYKGWPFRGDVRLDRAGRHTPRDRAEGIFGLGNSSTGAAQRGSSALPCLMELRLKRALARLHTPGERGANS